MALKWAFQHCMVIDQIKKVFIPMDGVDLITRRAIDGFWIWQLFGG
ncbi:hypothetical protein [Mucilaginibacter flavidus]|nr:hypothetical protein [Mucilaginibacter flavidus]